MRLSTRAAEEAIAEYGAAAAGVLRNVEPHQHQTGTPTYEALGRLWFQALAKVEALEGEDAHVPLADRTLAEDVEDAVMTVNAELWAQLKPKLPSGTMGNRVSAIRRAMQTHVTHRAASAGGRAADRAAATPFEGIPRVAADPVADVARFEIGTAQGDSTPRSTPGNGRAESGPLDSDMLATMARQMARMQEQLDKLQVPVAQHVPASEVGRPRTTLPGSFVEAGRRTAQDDVLHSIGPPPAMRRPSQRWPGRRRRPLRRRRRKRWTTSTR